MNKLLVICGATATGKTELAIECAKKLDSEIISADSQLVYKNLDIGTAKPSITERQGVIHHMIDIVDPVSDFSVSDYERKAVPIIENLLNKGKVPIICGGTGFYINSILYKLSYGNVAADKSIREKYEKVLAEKGKDYLYSLLKNFDPVTAEKLHPNDTKRIIRALEIFEAGGKRKSEIKDSYLPRYNFSAFAVDYPRDELYERIDKRIDVMLGRGLINEVKRLLKDGINENNQCMQAIGYKEVVDFLKNDNNDSTLRDIIKKNTHHYAKRQITFFKKLNGIHWIKPGMANSDTVLEIFNEQR